MKGEKTPVGIYPEGTIANGTCLLRFKKGAFISELPIKPVFFKFTGSSINPTYDSIEVWESLILVMSNFYNSCEVTELPVFKPNEYLFKERTDLGKSRSEIYGEAVRRVLAKVGGDLKLENNADHRVGFEYANRMHAENQARIEGKAKSS